jgi:hypothetical protein
MTNAKFIDLLFSNREPSAAPWVTSFTSAPADATRGEWAGWAVLRPHNVPRIDKRLANTYVVVSTFRPGPDGRYRRRKTHFVGMHAVMIDDIGTKIEESAIALPATVRIETSPANHQDWLKLDPPITDMALAERLVDRMIAAGLTASGKDPGMRGVTRYGRLPQGVNTKPRATGPWLHRVIEVREDHAYTAEEIAEAYALDLSPPPPRRQHGVIGDPSGAETLIGKLQAVGLYQGPLSDGWHAITCPWVHQHTNAIDTGTAYREPAEVNGWHGAFRCHHGHCDDRRVRHLREFFAHLAQEVRA